MNIVSLHKIFDSFADFITRFPKTVDVICLSEIQLNDRNLSYCNLPAHFTFNNSATKACGFAVYVSDTTRDVEAGAVEAVNFLWKRKHYEERSWNRQQTRKRLTLYGAGSRSKNILLLPHPY